jgi:hypothetical protein
MPSIRKTVPAFMANSAKIPTESAEFKGGNEMSSKVKSYDFQKKSLSNVCRLVCQQVR